MAGRTFTTELKVGVFTLACIGLVIFGYIYFWDGLRGEESAYTVSLTVPSADGLWEGTPVKIAGVEVGSISEIVVDGNQARLILGIRDTFPIPVDSTAELRSSGMLGDRYVGLDLGRSEAMVTDGGHVRFGEAPGDLDVITRQVEDVADDVKAITAALREVVENRDNTDHLEATLANVDAITYEMRLMTENNRRDIDAIVDSVRRLTERLAETADDASADVDEELDKLKDATDDLDDALEDVKSITTKIDEGQGTLGALVNERETIDSLNDTIENANSVIDSFSGLHAEVYYLGRVFGGTQPDDPAFFYGNPAAPNENGGFGYAGSNNLGLELHPQEDFWWIFEINDYPQGVIRAQEHYFPESGAHWTEWTRDLDYRFTFQMSKRWWNVAFRLGVKESGGGIGATWYLARDRLMLNADAFDFTFGPYPALEASGLPNLRVGARLEPLHHVWLETGGEQILLGARYGYVTGYLGAGFHFSDDDIKLLFATLPLGF
ncbi:MAG: MCE family protein [Alphaproteobacteria bacterium]|nr:MCE family protein [Alphaproteobacteria bacterium]